MSARSAKRAKKSSKTPCGRDSIINEDTLEQNGLVVNLATGLLEEVPGWVQPTAEQLATGTKKKKKRKTTDSVEEPEPFAAEPSKKSKGERAWCFTLNNYTAEECAAIATISSANYIVYGKEVAPTTGTPHLQGFIYFRDQKTLSAVKKILPRCHLSVKSEWSSFQAAAGYCKKGNTPDDQKPVPLGWAHFCDLAHESWDGFECGTRPRDAKEKGEAEIERYQVAWEQAKAGKFEEIDADIRVRHYATLQRIAHDHAPRLPTLDTLVNVWYWGLSGGGKSRRVREMYPDAYVKPASTKWWDNYMQEPVVILEDWDIKAPPDICAMLKVWSDHYPFRGESKGGSQMMRPERLIVTSNYTLDECFRTDWKGLYEPLSRRFTEVEIQFGPQNKPH